MNGWIEVTPPPRPYLTILRRELRNGLQVLVLTLEVDGEFQVLSMVDHGTKRRTRIREGGASTTDALADLAARTCEQWDATDLTLSSPQRPPEKRYYYLAAPGKISEAVSRETLFALLDKGTLGWGSQVWEEMAGAGNLSEWRPILDVLGFPRKNDVILKANEVRRQDVGNPFTVNPDSGA